MGAVRERRLQVFQKLRAPPDADPYSGVMQPSSHAAGRSAPSGLFLAAGLPVLALPVGLVAFPFGLLLLPVGCLFLPAVAIVAIVLLCRGGWRSRRDRTYVWAALVVATVELLIVSVPEPL